LKLWDEKKAEEHSEVSIVETIELKKIKTTLIDEIKKLEAEIDKVTRLNLYYPKDYRISFEEYNELKEMLKSKVSIMRSKE
jgi:hypothetical protein